MAVDCIVLVLYNTYVLIWNKVYTSWTTFVMVMSCSLLLACRMAFLILYALYRYDLTNERALVRGAILTDFPCFFVQMITLSLIWQWNRIAHLLKDPEEAMGDVY